MSQAGPAKECDCQVLKKEIVVLKKLLEKEKNYSQKLRSKYSDLKKKYERSKIYKRRYLSSDEYDHKIIHRMVSKENSRILKKSNKHMEAGEMIEDKFSDASKSGRI
jgi:hypothetical protein